MRKYLITLILYFRKSVSRDCTRDFSAFLTQPLLYIMIIYMDSQSLFDFSKITGFDWDEWNINKSWEKHLVNPAECEESFMTESKLISKDEKNSVRENRYRMLSQTFSERRLFIVFTIRKNKIRIISARDQSRKERNQYDSFIKI